MFIYAGVQNLQEMLEYTKAMTEQDKLDLQNKVKETMVRISQDKKDKPVNTYDAKGWRSN